MSRIMCVLGERKRMKARIKSQSQHSEEEEATDTHMSAE